MANFKYRGLIAPVFTPLKDDFSINLEIIPKYGRYLAENGIRGVLVNGTVGEGPALNVYERKLVCEKWAETVKQTRQHLMVQIGGAPLPDIILLAKHAEDNGVDSLLCLPELYYKPKNAIDLREYLNVIANAVPKTPILYYHIPSFTNVNVNMAEFLRTVDGEIPNFAGIKFTSTCLDECVDAANYGNRKYAVFLGADTLMLGAYSLGLDSAIATSFNIHHRHGLEIFAKAITHPHEALRRQQQLTGIVNELCKFGDWVQVWKHAMNSLTPIDCGPIRPPLQPMPEDKAIEMLAAVKQIQSMST